MNIRSPARVRVHFSWAMHYLCNYRCPYCVYDGRWEQLAPAHRGMPPVPRLIEIWRGVFDRFGPCIIQTMGGEPTLLPGFDDLLAGTLPHHYWFITSNLSWPAERWQRLLARVDGARLDVMGSYHPTEAPFERFLEAILLLKTAGVRTAATLVAYPPLLGRLEGHCLELRRHGVDANVQPFQGSFEGRAYPNAYAPAELEALDVLNGRIRARVVDLVPYMLDQVRPTGKPCTAGQLYCHVDPAGELYRCTMTMQPERRLGNLFGEFELLAEPAPCPAEACHCESRWLVEERERAGMTAEKAGFAAVPE